MIYKKQDIDRMFTEKVSELLAQGYQINPATMDGSQGEIAHVDLRKGEELIRVLLERRSGWDDDAPDYLSLTVGRCAEPFRNDSFNAHETIWNNDLEILSEIKFASATLSLYDSPVYLDMASGTEAAKKRQRRWEARQLPNRRNLPEASKSVALRWLKKQKGFKTCRLSEIESVVRVDDKTTRKLYCYEIKARGKIFRWYPLPA